MGLDCSHDAFHGAYSAFNRFRQVVAHAMGGSFPPHWKVHPSGELVLDDRGLPIYDESLDDKMIYYDTDGITPEQGPGLWLFLRHSDCDGEISPEDCRKVADEMEAILPDIEKAGEGGGHIAARGGFGEVARKFIRGCREAAANNEPLEFY